MEIILKIKNVEEVSGWYHFRIAIPEDVRKQIGQREVKKSLDTKDPLVAKRLAEPLRRQWKAKIKRAREGLKARHSEVGQGSVASQALKFVERFTSDRVYGVSVVDQAILEAFINGLVVDLNKLKADSALSVVSVQEVVATYPAVFAWEEVEHLTHGQSPREALLLVLNVATLIRKAVAEEMQFHDIEDLSSSVDLKAAERLVQVAENPPKPLLSEVLEQVIKVDPDRESRFRNHIGNLIEWCGNKPCDQYSFESLLAYRTECLERLPDRRGAKYNGMTLREAMEVATPEDFLSSNTVVGHLRSIITLFNFAKKKHKVDLDLDGLVPKKRKTPRVSVREKRYTTEELQAMIDFLPSVKGSPVRFWVPLIALYQGARLNEICQLHTEDVRAEGGIWVFDINEYEPERTKKSLKTEVSKRVIPVHPALIELGFVSFVEGRKRELGGGSAVLFDDVVYSEKHHYRRPVSRWFNETDRAFKRKFLSAERADKMHFHHFRHTWIQQAQDQARVVDKLSKEMRGHTSDTATSRSYVDINLVQALLEELQKLDYGLDLSPIMGLY